MIKALFATLPLLLASPAWAAVYTPLSDLTVGNRTSSPAANTVIADTGALTAGTTGGRYDVTFTFNSTLLGTFVFGLYDGADAAVAGKTMTITVLTNEVKQVTWHNVFIPNGYKLKVVNAVLLLTGTVQASINYEEKARD